MKQILTLCEKCHAVFEEHYSVKPYCFNRATTKPEKKCAHCKRNVRDMGMYIIDKKRR
jgi:hypothetical protein